MEPSVGHVRLNNRKASQRVMWAFEKYAAASERNYISFKFHPYLS